MRRQARVKDRASRNIRLAERGNWLRKQSPVWEGIINQAADALAFAAFRFVFEAAGKVQERPAAARVEVEDPDCQR